jgi:hypothetical protein
MARSISSYRPTRFPDRVAVFCNAEVPQEQRQALWAAWQNQGIRHLELGTVPGDHVTMWNEPNAAVLREQVRCALEKAWQGAS